jgi:hydrogenase expression/formation protein HypC
LGEFVVARERAVSARAGDGVFRGTAGSVESVCLGLPGRVVEVTAGSDLARVDVAGVVRDINLGLLDGPWAPGDYVLIHSGFALQRMTAEDAQLALQVFAVDTAGPPDAMPR